MSKAMSKRKATPDGCRWMVRKDLHEAIGIEASCYSRPWNEDDFNRKMRERNTTGLVCDHNGAVAGFMLYELHKHRLGLVKLVVDPIYHRCGIGTILVEKLKSKLSVSRRERITVEVPESQLGVQLFFKAMGFKARDVFRNKFTDDDGNPEDAYFMEYRIAGAKDA